jgi:Carboxypeptidase regulatory-like domain
MQYRSLLLWLVLVAAAALPAFGQATFATLTGEVTDPNGAAVPSAEIVVTQAESNYRYETRSNTMGLYTVPQLREGTYSLKANATGFHEFAASDIRLASRQVLRFDVRLELGTVQSSIDVTGFTSEIQTETSNISAMKTADTMKALPFNTRAMYAFLQMTPGVLVMTGNNAYMRFAGSRGNQENEAVDGTTFNNMYDGSLMPHADFIEGFQEMRVDMANNSAEYGALGQVTFISKSGTNELRGSLFDYYSSAGMGARNPFSPDRTSYVKHSLGGSVGGPVYIPGLYNGKNKTFFFFSIENMRGSAIQQLLTPTVPLASWRSGDFSGLGIPIRDPFNNNTPFPNGKIPTSRINAVSQKVQDYFYPLPNYGDTSSFANQNYRATVPYSYPPYTQLAPRIDHRFSDKDFVFGRYNWQRENFGGIDGQLPALGRMGAVRDNRGLNMSYTHVFNPSLLNEFHWGFSRNDAPRYPADLNGKELVDKFGLTGLENLPTNVNSLPKFNFSDIGLNGIDVDEDWRVPGFRNRVYQFQDQVSWFRGRHSVKFGTDFSRVGFADGPIPAHVFGAYTFSERFTGFGYADFLLGIPTTAQVDPMRPAYTLHRNAYNLFITDDFKISSRLTLNIGLRYELKPGFTEDNGLISSFDLKSGKIVVPDKAMGSVSKFLPTHYVGVISASEAGLPDSLFHTDKNNFAPRIGMAYRPWGNNTVFRAGFGMFYDVVPHSPLAVNTPFFFGVPAFTNPSPNPTLVFPQAFPANGMTSPSTVNIPAAVDPNLAFPYSLQYNFTIERQQWNTGFRISYVGTGTRHGEYQYNVNQPIANGELYINKPRLYPQYPGFNYVTNGSGHQYHGLTVSAKRDLAKGLSYQFSWDWARDIGDLERDWGPEDAYNRARERGVWLDVPTHRITSFLVYDLPIGHGKKLLSRSNRVLDALVGGWQLASTFSTYSGRFMTPYWIGPDPVGIAYTDSSTAPIVRLRPDQLSNPNLPGDQRGVNEWFDVNAFAGPQQGHLGSASRGSIKGPNARVLNAGLSKYFNLTERVRLRLEGTATNLPNHPNYTDPDTTITNVGSAGVLTGVGGEPAYEGTGPRNIRVGLRLEW